MKKSTQREKLEDKYQYFKNNYEIIGKVGEGKKKTSKINF